ncbi:MAG: PepSY domain-containing protein [Rhodobacteraceae bacterium]|nr:MAG: PepSY domain-containing protein [Paracoccaceae bacterium]
MKIPLTTLALVALLPAGAALADDDCTVPRDQWQPREAVMQLAAQNGWTVTEFEIDDGCYEIEGRDADGREIEVKLDPATLQVVKMEYETDRTRSRAPAATEQPPQDATTPPVETK